ncbi:hypothetical protein BDZ97DRAFT_297656 [Flammula alnicola]|nr:hypothetical protein BDZ97DRAFT_297656 [Flammula alnicola]
MAVTIDDTLGAASIGFYVSCVIFGVFTTQVYVFFQRFPQDKIAYKLLVAFLWILEVVDQSFIAYSMYYYTVAHYNQPLVLQKGHIVWPLVVQIVLGNFVGTVVKFCFAMRVWRFSKKNIWITGLIVLLILAQFGLAIVYCVRAFQIVLLDVRTLRIIASLALGAGLITDLTIAAALCYFLRKLRTGHRKADTLINSLTIYAVNTGALTGVVSLLTVVLYNTRPETFDFMASYFTLSKLYAISFLCTLNTRKVLRGRGTDAEGNTTTPRDLEYSANQTKSLEIGIHQEVSIVGDMEYDAQDASVDKSKFPGTRSLQT